MHPDKSFGWQDEEKLLQFVADCAFIRLFVQLPVGPRVAHVPVLVHGGRLRFHLANRNAITSQLDGLVALAVAEGSNAYISANWYHDVRGAVPTWNYTAVEVEGSVRTLGRDELIALVDALSRTLEPRVAENWTRAKMEPARFEALLGAITAFELTPTALRGTRKLSQNKPDHELESLAMGLLREGQETMVAAMHEARR